MSSHLEPPTMKDADSEENVHCRTELQTIASGAGIIFFGKIVGGAFQYLYLVILARCIGATSLGVLAIGLVLIDILGIASRLGMEGGAVKFISLFNSERDNGRIKGVIVQALSISLGFSLILVCAIMFFPGKNFFDSQPGLDSVFRILLLSLPFLSMMVVVLYSTQGFKNMTHTVFCQSFLLPLISIASFLLLFTLGYGMESAAWAYVIATFCAFTSSLFFLKKIFPEILRIKPVYEFKKLIKFSLPMLIMYLAMSTLLMTDVLMLGYLRPGGEVGAYNAAMKTALLMKVVITSFVPMFTPVISELYGKKDMGKMGTLYKAANRWTFMISLPIFLLIIVLSKDIMLIFGEDFLVASTALVILGLTQLLDAATGLALVVLAMSGREKLIMLDCIGVALFAVLANYILIPVYGLTGAAVANLLTFLLLDLLLMLQTYYLFKIHPFGVRMLKPALCGAVAFGCITFCNQFFFSSFSSLARVATVSSLFLPVFIGMSFLFGLDDDDNFVIDMIKRKFRSVSAN